MCVLTHTYKKKHPPIGLLKLTVDPLYFIITKTQSRGGKRAYLDWGRMRSRLPAGDGVKRG